MKKKKNNKWGGKREGSGRKPGIPNKKKKEPKEFKPGSKKGVQYWTRLEAKYVWYLKHSDNAAKLIEQALDNTFEIPEITESQADQLTRRKPLTASMTG